MFVIVGLILLVSSCVSKIVGLFISWVLVKFLDLCVAMVLQPIDGGLSLKETQRRSFRLTCSALDLDGL
jgi:hypothetical protein